MVETTGRVIAFLGDLPQQYLGVKFALMPAGEWFQVLHAHPESDRWVARVRCLPEAVVECLSVSPNIDVRGTVAFRAGLFAGVQYRLVNDLDVSVRRRLAAGRGTLIEVLVLLAKDKAEEVRMMAERRLAVSGGRLDAREARGRSRKHWGAGHFAPKIALALARETYRDALVKQAVHYERINDFLRARGDRPIDRCWPVETEWPLA